MNTKQNTSNFGPIGSGLRASLDGTWITEIDSKQHTTIKRTLRCELKKDTTQKNTSVFKCGSGFGFKSASTFAVELGISEMV